MLRQMLIKNISWLVQAVDIPGLRVSGRDMSELKTIRNAFLLISDGLIDDYGTMDYIPGKN
jgi:imidazolonepropionase